MQFITNRNNNLTSNRTTKENIHRSKQSSDWSTKETTNEYHIRRNIFSMLHNVSIIHAPCIFQLKNHGARNGNVGPVARVNFTRGVFSNGVEEKSPALLPFCPAAKVEKKLEQIFSPARNVFTIYDIRIKLISEIKSWYRNFFRLFSCFRKSNKWRGGCW